MKDVLVFDTETTGLVPKGAKYDVDFNAFPYIVSLSWCMNGVEKDFIIYPEIPIPKEAEAVHGISTEKAISEGVPFVDVIVEFIIDCQKAKKVVGHNVYFDTSIIKANLLRALNEATPWKNHAFENPFLDLEKAIHKDKRIDTMMKTIKFVGAKQEGSNRGKFPTLEELYFKLFSEKFEAHKSIHDVRAVVRCLPELQRLGLVIL